MHNIFRHYTHTSIHAHTMYTYTHIPGNSMVFVTGWFTK